MADQSILVNVGADISDLTSSMTTASRSVSRFVSDTQKGFKAIGDLGKIVTGLGLAVAAGLGGAVKVSADFDTAIRKAGAIAGASASELDAMKKSALDLGAKTSKSATEVATAMTELAAKGFDANQTIAAMPGIIKAAEASGEDLAMVSDTITSALNAFHMEAKDSSKVADIMAMAANKSAAGIGDMQYAFKYAAPAAAQLGISLEELAAATGIMANAGIKGESAGTTLRMAMLRLVKPPKQARKALDELGITVTDQDGKFKSFKQLIGELGKSMEGMTQAQKTAAIGAIFGAEAMSGMMTLISNGPDALGEFTTALEKSGGAAAKTAAQMKAGIGGALERLRGAIESLAISIGDQLVPYIITAADFLAKLVNWFNGLSDATKKFLVIGAALTSIFALFIGPILILIGFIPAIIEGFAAIAAIFGITSGALLGIIGVTFGWIAAIALVVSAIVIAYNEVDWFRNAVNAAWVWIVKATKVAAEAIKAAFGVAIDWTVQKFNQIKPALMAIGSWISGAFTGTISAISSFFGKLNEKFGIVSKVVNFVKNSFDTIGSTIATLSPLLARLALMFLGVSGPVGWIIAAVVSLGATLFKLSKTNESVRAAFESAWNGIKAVFGAVMTALQPAMDAFAQAFVDLAPEFAKTGQVISDSIKTLGPAFAQLGPAFAELVSAVVALIPAFTEVAKTIVNLYATIFPQLLNTAVQVFQGISTVVSTVLPIIINLIKTIIPIVGMIVTTVLPLLLQIFASVFQMIVSIIVAVMPVIVGLIQAIVPVIMQIVTTVLPLLLSIVQAVFPVIMSIIQAVIPVIVAIINVAASIITNVLVPAISFILQIVQAVFPVIVAVITSALNIIMNIIKIVTGIIKGDWSAVWEGIKGIFIAVWEAIKAVVIGAVNVVKTIISGAWELIKGITSSVWNGIKTLFSTILDGIVSVVTSSFNAMKTIISTVSNSIKGVIQTGWDSAVAFLEGIDLYQIGKNILQGLIDGIASMGGAIQSKIESMASLIPEWAKDILGVHSPSRVMMEIGEFTGEGFVNGIKSMIADVKGVTADMASAALPDTSQLSLAYETPAVPSPSRSAINFNGAQDKSSTDNKLISAIRELAGRPVSISIDGRQVALATSNDIDSIFANKARMDFRSQGGKR
jgi:TP901 family phage tail tape measure protein